jgi:uncharacterized membrane protein YqjE
MNRAEVWPLARRLLACLAGGVVLALMWGQQEGTPQDFGFAFRQAVFGPRILAFLGLGLVAFVLITFWPQFRPYAVRPGVRPLLAGLLVVAASPGWALAIDAATFAVSAAFLTRLRLPAHVNTASQSFIKDLKRGWGAFTEHTWVWSFVFAIAVGNIFWAAWSALGPVVAKQELGGAAAWGTVLAAMGAGGVLGGGIAIRANPRRPMLLVVGTGPIFATPIALLAAHAHTALLAVAAFCSGVVLVLGNAIWESTLQRQIPREEMSRVSAYDWFGSLAFYPLGLALWGPVSDQIGIYPSLWLAFGLISAVMLTLFAVKDMYRLTNAPPTRDAPEPAAPSR